MTGVCELAGLSDADSILRQLSRGKNPEGSEATGPITFAGIALVLALIAAAASLAPGRRASPVDSMVTLRASNPSGGL